MTKNNRLNIKRDKIVKFICIMLKSKLANIFD